MRPRHRPETSYRVSPGAGPGFALIDYFLSSAAQVGRLSACRYSHYVVLGPGPRACASARRAFAPRRPGARYRSRITGSPSGSNRRGRHRSGALPRLSGMDSSRQVRADRCPVGCGRWPHGPRRDVSTFAAQHGPAGALAEWDLEGFRERRWRCDPVHRDPDLHLGLAARRGPRCGFGAAS